MWRSMHEDHSLIIWPDERVLSHTQNPQMQGKLQSFEAHDTTEIKSFQPINRVLSSVDTTAKI